MSKEKKTGIIAYISAITGLLTIIVFLLNGEHRLTQVETNLNLVIGMQKEIRKEILPNIASDIQKLRDLYLGIDVAENTHRNDPRKPE